MKILKKFGINLGICYTIMIVLFLITAAIFAHTNISDKYIDIFIYATIIISTFTTSMLLNKKIKEKGIIYGAIFGLVVMALFYLTISILMPQVSFTMNTLIFFIVAIISSSLGGIIGVNL